jgi:hypothetical protein
MILPFLFLMASMAFSAPSVLGDNLEHQVSVNPQNIRDYVEQYFADEPILADIAWCESRLRHFGKDGQIFRGTIDSDDIGIMQINTRYHANRAEKLGLDIYSLSGNLDYAKYLYEKEGSKPWRSSQACWGQLVMK